MAFPVLQRRHRSHFFAAAESNSRQIPICQKYHEPSLDSTRVLSNLLAVFLLLSFSSDQRATIRVMEHSVVTSEP